MRIRGYLALLFATAFLAACEPGFDPAGNAGIVLAVQCGDPVVTKAQGEIPGQDPYNENRIYSVDFFFYPGENPEGNAVYHARKTADANLSETFNLNVDSGIRNKIFPAGGSGKATVFAVVNAGTIVAPENETALEHTSLAELEAISVKTDFVGEEDVNNYFRQPSFMMSGTCTIDLIDGGTQQVVASGTVDVRRYASKITVGVSIQSQVEIQHEGAQSEFWSPVLSSIQVYLENGTNSVKLGGSSDFPAEDDLFSYSDEEHRRYFVKQDGTTYLPPEDGFYQTYPMYTYPLKWEFSAETAPYLKLIVTWKRLEENGYSFTERQFYYKVFIPDDARGGNYVRRFIRNNWYHYNIDVGILGADTDDGRVILNAMSFYVVDWQDKNVVRKHAEIGDVRYLSVTEQLVELNNIPTTTIHYVSSHALAIKDISATRPYYGESKSVGTKLIDQGDVKAWLRKKTVGGRDFYYLDYDTSNWLTNGTLVDNYTSLSFNHALDNDYTKTDFDYSPYDITFTLVHEDLKDLEESNPLYTMYSHKVTIRQYPGIYIEARRNSDEVTYANTDNDTKSVLPYFSPGDVWGYVYVDGGDGTAITSLNENEVQANTRYVRKNKANRDNQNNPNTFGDYFSTYSNDSFYQLTTDEARKEYQWRTVWYTGGSRDMFNIHVTVLPDEENFNFVIGDPRTSVEDNLGYSYTNKNETDAKWLIDREDGFAEAPALYGDSPRRLTWYYPTESTSRTMNMLAPCYRIASKFGGVEYGKGFFSDITFDHAQYRCAAYQEDGYPAGRWRLPTYGEIRFIAQLSANKVFEFLFTPGSTYWSANGAVTVGSGANSVTLEPGTSMALMRCVYDSWYWGNEPPEGMDKTKFTWGDEPR